MSATDAAIIDTTEANVGSNRVLAAAGYVLTGRWFVGAVRCGLQRLNGATVAPAAEPSTPGRASQTEHAGQVTPPLAPLGTLFTPLAESKAPRPGLLAPRNLLGEIEERSDDTISHDSESASVAFWRAQIEAIYQKRNPYKLSNVSQLLSKYRGQEVLLYRKVCHQYDLDPTRFYTDPEAWPCEEESSEVDMHDENNSDAVAASEMSSHISAAAAAAAATFGPGTVPACSFAEKDLRKQIYNDRGSSFNIRCKTGSAPLAASCNENSRICKRPAPAAQSLFSDISHGSLSQRKQRLDGVSASLAKPEAAASAPYHKRNNCIAAKARDERARNQASAAGMTDTRAAAAAVRPAMACARVADLLPLGDHLKHSVTNQLGSEANRQRPQHETQKQDLGFNRRALEALREMQNRRMDTNHKGMEAAQKQELRRKQQEEMQKQAIRYASSATVSSHTSHRQLVASKRKFTPLTLDGTTISSSRVAAVTAEWETRCEERRTKMLKISRSAPIRSN
jgi:hypothetical protein